MAEPAFTCNTCGESFTMKPEVLAKYPGWKPTKCWKCKSSGAAKAAPGKRRPATARGKKRGKKRGSSKEQNLTREKVLEKYTEGPFDGVFTDGACSGNPGPGGWGMVWVKDNEVLEERHGHEPQTTNNRMELAALIAAYEMLPEDAEVTIWSDSNLCVQTINQWAAGWKRMGWTRKKGAEVKNLELVRRAYELSLRHRGAKLRWIKAHNGSRWNEYADSLATGYMRDEL